MRVKATGRTREQVEAARNAEAREQARQEAKASLAAGDWRVIRAAEAFLAQRGELPTELRQERQALRDMASEDA
jgi:hypothetical protein